MNIDEITHNVIKHKEASSFLNLTLSRVVSINHEENGCKDLVHSLNILNSRVESRVDVKNASHVVISIGFSLFLLTSHKLFVALLTLSINDLELLSPCAC